MTDVVLSTLDNNILSSTENVATISTTRTESVVVEGNHSSVVVLSSESNVLVDSISASVLVTGLVGPPGPSGTSEEDNMYAKRVDFINDLLLYRGEAVVGTAESYPAWRIRQVILSVDGDVSETWASGNANFDKVWADRALLSYS
jgi:hypothetical protein